MERSNVSRLVWRAAKQGCRLGIKTLGASAGFAYQHRKSITKATKHIGNVGFGALSGTGDILRSIGLHLLITEKRLDTRRSKIEAQAIEYQN